MINRFLEILQVATAQIQQTYFQLPIAGQEDPIYRERVYCYELYHQIRPLLERDRELSRYTLSGEIDKAGHKIIRPYVPDFVIHDPGRMDNLAIIEVKPINGRLDGVRKDLETLAYFVSEQVAYKCGIHLIYGEDERALESFRQQFLAVGHKKLRLFSHRRSGEPATSIA